MTEPALPADLQQEKFKADVATAKANADKAQADAAKATADAEKARADAEKARADAATARTASEKAAADLASARATQAATDAKTVAEAEKATVEARAAQITALVPDLGTAAEASTLAGADTASFWGGELVYTALSRAAGRLGSEVAGMLTPDTPQGRARVLVVSDVDIATIDATVVEVERGLDQLISSTAGLAEVIDTLVGRGEVDTQGLDLVTVAGALAKALPGVLSLFSARRTVRSATTEIGDLEAAAAVIGALRHTGVDLFHEDFRLTPTTRLHAKVAEVEGNRQRLATSRLELTEKRGTADTIVVTTSAELEQALARAAKAPADAELQATIHRHRLAIAEASHDSRSAGEQITAIDVVVAAVDGFLAAARSTPPGAKRSPLSTAALYSVVHRDSATTESSAAPMTHVLLVKAHAADARQTLHNRALWFNDRFSVTVEAAVSYLLLDTADSQIVSAGTTVGTVRAWGTIGQRIESDTDTDTNSGSSSRGS